jgi:hypothetical protein
MTNNTPALTVFILIILFLSITSLPGYAPAEQTPCLNLTAVDNPAIAYKQRGNRCEGFYQSPVSAGSLDLVSLLRGRLDFDPKKDTMLYISAPQVRKRQVHIQAVGIPIKTYYRLDAWLEPGERLEWPLEIIRKMNLRPGHIGLFGQPVIESAEQAEPTKSDVYVPLSITRAAGGTAGGIAGVTGEDSDAAPAPLNLILRSSVDVGAVMWRTSDFDGRQCGRLRSDTAWKPIKPDWDDRFFSGEAIKLRLLQQVDDFCIEFAAQTVGSASWLKLSLKIRMGE